MRGCEFVCGQRGQGKTTYIKRKILYMEPRILIYDHMAEFRGLKGLETVNTVEECILYLKGHQTGFCRVVLSTTTANPEEFDLVCKIPFAFKDIVFVCDEIDTFAGAIWPPENFKKLIHFGRHAGCSFVGIARRPANVARDFTSQAKRYTCFRQTEPADLKFLRSVVGPRAEDLRNLPPYHYLAFEDGKILKGKL